MRPEGVRGRVFGWLMERINERAYRLALERLAPGAGERILEIGFGTGRLVERLLAAGPEIAVCGVDPAPTMVAVARARRGVREAGARADLRVGEVMPLPWPDASFDAAAALHSFQFWSEPAAALHEVRRVLRPRGRLLLVLRDHGRRAPAWLPNPLSRSGREPQAAAELLRETGFADVVLDVAGGASAVLSARAPA